MRTTAREPELMKAKLLPIPMLILALDQWSKWWIEQTLSRYESFDVIPGFFKITHVTNTGIAFGLFPSGGALPGTLLLTVLGMTALAIVTLYFLRAHESQRLLLVALALIMGGAVGNLIDRIMLRAVTDFLELYIGSYTWPTFNVADSAITVGICLLALETIRGEPAIDTSPDGDQPEQLPTAVARGS